MPETKAPSIDNKSGISQRKLAARKLMNGVKYNKMASKLFHAGSQASLEDMFIAASRDGDFERLSSFFQQTDNMSVVNIDARDKTTGNTSLIFAAKRAHTKNVQFLLDHGADVTLRNYNNLTAVEVASPAIKVILLDHVGKRSNAPNKALLHASWQGNLNAMKNILEARGTLVDVNCHNSDGLSSLMLVCRDLHLFERLSRQLNRPYNPVEVVVELLSAQADLHLRDPESKSCLHYAASSRATVAPQIVELLVESGFHTELKDQRSFTPLHCASQTGNAGSVAALLTRGSEVNTKGYGGTTPLHIAAYNDHEDVAAILLSHGADVTSANDGNLIASDVAKGRKMRLLLKRAMDSQIEGNSAVDRPGADNCSGEEMLNVVSVTPLIPLKHRILRQLTNTERTLTQDTRSSTDHLSPNPQSSENVRRLGLVRSAPRVRKSSNSAVDKLPPVVTDRQPTPDQRNLRSASTTKLQNLDVYNVTAADEHMKYLAALSNQIVAYDNELQENIRKLSQQERPTSQGHHRSRSDVSSMAALAASCQEVMSRSRCLSGPDEEWERWTSVPRRLIPLQPVTQTTSHTTDISTFITQPSDADNLILTLSQEASPRSDEDDFPELIRFEEVKRSTDFYYQSSSFLKSDFLTAESRSNESMMLSSGSDNSVESHLNGGYLQNENSENDTRLYERSGCISVPELVVNKNVDFEERLNNILTKFDTTVLKQFDGLCYDREITNNLNIIADAKNLDIFDDQTGLNPTGKDNSIQEQHFVYRNVESCDNDNKTITQELKAQIVLPKSFTVPLNRVSVIDAALPNIVVSKQAPVKLKLTKYTINSTQVENAASRNAKLTVKPTRLITSAKKRDILNNKVKNDTATAGKDKLGETKTAVKAQSTIPKYTKSITNSTDNVKKMAKVKTKSKITSGVAEPKLKTAWGTAASRTDVKQTKQNKEELLVSTENGTQARETDKSTASNQNVGNNNRNKVRFSLGKPNQTELVDLGSKQQTPIIVDAYKDMQPDFTELNTAVRLVKDGTARSILREDKKRSTSANKRKGAEAKNTTSDRPISGVRVNLKGGKKKKKFKVVGGEPELPVDRPDVAVISGNGWHIVTSRDSSAAVDRFILENMIEDEEEVSDYVTNNAVGVNSGSEGELCVNIPEIVEEYIEGKRNVEEVVCNVGGGGDSVSNYRDSKEVSNMPEGKVLFDEKYGVPQFNNYNNLSEISENCVNSNFMNLDNAGSTNAEVCRHGDGKRTVLGEGTCVLVKDNSLHLVSGSSPKYRGVIPCNDTNNRTDSIGREIGNKIETNVDNTGTEYHRQDQTNKDDENLNDIVEEILGSSTMNNSSMKSIIRRNSSGTGSLTEGSGSLLTKLKNRKSLFHAKSQNYDETPRNDASPQNGDEVNNNTGRDVAMNNTTSRDDSNESVNSDSSTLRDIETNSDLMKLFHAEDYNFGEKVQAMLNAGANTTRLEAMLAVENKHIERVMHSFKQIELQTNRRGLIQYDDGKRGEQTTVTRHKLETVPSVNKGRFHEIKQENLAPQNDIVAEGSGSKHSKSSKKAVPGSSSYHSQEMFRSDSASSTCSNKSASSDDTVQWTKGNILGRGAFGTVWCGLTSYGEMIAIKQIELNISASEKATTEYEKIQEEVELLKTLNHRNIVGYLGTSFVDEVVSIYMEFVPGGSIASVLARFGALNESVFCRYTKQILEGVRYLHANDIIHRDIKGGNVMLMPTGVIKLIDFGCAKRMCINLSLSQSQILKSMKGTPYWMAPEIVNESGHGKKSDIWSVGCTVFEMATGKPPWAGMNPIAAIFAIGTHKPVPQLPETFSKPARDFVNACLTRDQNKRPSACELLSHCFLHKRKVSNR